MSRHSLFSIKRCMAVMVKEWLHMSRDRVTLGMIIGIPLIQLTLFGFAINTNPRHLPTLLVNQDNSPQVRHLISALQYTSYFAVSGTSPTLEQARKRMQTSDAQFIIHIPADFSKRLIRDEHPELLLITDGTAPMANGNAVSALNELAERVFQRRFHKHGLAYLLPDEKAFRVNVHNRYNPEKITRYNIVPGLVGVILTMTLVMITGLAITRERESGTMEGLLATPLRPLEVISGKITPYIGVGYLQLLLILAAARWVFGIPFYGNMLLLLVATLPFIIANLLMGITFSTLARNQLQAMQMTFFFFLPSILLSGFMFPFYGMPRWAQYLGEMLPLTHYLRIIRGIVLKGTTFEAVSVHLWPILIFITLIALICIKRFRETL